MSHHHFKKLAKKGVFYYYYNISHVYPWHQKMGRQQILDDFYCKGKLLYLIIIIILTYCPDQQTPLVDHHHHRHPDQLSQATDIARGLGTRNASAVDYRSQNQQASFVVEEPRINPDGPEQQTSLVDWGPTIVTLFNLDHHHQVSN